MATHADTLSRNAEVVMASYDDFGQGNVQSLLARLAEDVEFRLAEGHPYQPSGKPWTGKEALVEHFFKKAGPEWEGWTVDVREVHELGDTVVVEARYRGLYKPTGRSMDLQVCHVWKLRDGLVRSFHQYVDTGALQHLMGRR
jgi:ketosteroid isomerase-like protein